MWLQRAHSMISVDTGPAHAAALDCPLVVIFGFARLDAASADLGRMAANRPLHRRNFWS